MEDEADKLKSYINEISLLAEKDPFNYQALKKCFDSFELSNSQIAKLNKIASSHIKRSEELLKNGRIEEALMSMERAVEIHPLSDEFRNRIAQLYLLKARREGSEGKNRQLASKHASFSKSVTDRNPIADNILKDIRNIEKALSGKTSYKKLLLPFAGLLLLVAAALFTQNRFSFSFLQQKSPESETSMAVPSAKKTETFTDRELETVITGQLEDCEIEIDQSRLSLTNGSISYTLQGKLINESKAIKSAGLNVAFRQFDGEILFSKTIPLVEEEQWLMPGEPALIDEFFYVHYLPPEIDEVRISLRNMVTADEIPEQEEEQPISVEWTAYRPEGVKIDFSQLESSSFQGYGENYINIKLKMINSGTIPVERFQIDLKWRNFSGDELFSLSRDLIQWENPVLSPEETRIFRIFTNLPTDLPDEGLEMYINVTRINS